MLHLSRNAATDRRTFNHGTVSIAAGEIQFVEQSGGELIDLTRHRFDLEDYPQSDHACTTITRSDAHFLVLHFPHCWPVSPSRGKLQMDDRR